MDNSNASNFCLFLQSCKLTNLHYPTWYSINGDNLNVWCSEDLYDDWDLNTEELADTDSTIVVRVNGRYIGVVFETEDDGGTVGERKLNIEFLDGSNQWTFDFENAEKYEISGHGASEWKEQVIAELLQSGLIPVLAHPERIEMFQKDINSLDELLEMGLLTQITSGSLMGYFGDIAKEFIKVLYWKLQTLAIS